MKIKEVWRLSNYDIVCDCGYQYVTPGVVRIRRKVLRGQQLPVTSMVLVDADYASRPVVTMVDDGDKLGESVVIEMVCLDCGSVSHIVVKGWDYGASVEFHSPAEYAASTS